LKASVSKKLGEPQLNQIRLYDLRHFAGSMAYYKTKDIIYTMRFMEHKNIKNTLRYVHLINFDKEYHVSVAKTVDDVFSILLLPKDLLNMKKILYLGTFCYYFSMPDHAKMYLA
jgi:hypothetical protein